MIHRALQSRDAVTWAKVTAVLAGLVVYWPWIGTPLVGVLVLALTYVALGIALLVGVTLLMAFCALPSALIRYMTRG